MDKKKLDADLDVVKEEFDYEKYEKEYGYDESSSYDTIHCKHKSKKPKNGAKPKWRAERKEQKKLKHNNRE